MINRFRSLFKGKRLKRTKVVKGLLLRNAKSSLLKLPIYILLLEKQSSSLNINAIIPRMCAGR